LLILALFPFPFLFPLLLCYATPFDIHALIHDAGVSTATIILEKSLCPPLHMYFMHS
jgi:hypothetical protein